MQRIECEQYSPEWWQVRLGKPTASAFSQIITAAGKPSKSAEGYMYQLVAERITGKAEETFQSLKMQEGKEREATSRRIYQMDNEVEVEQVGFCLSDDGLYGCSPDGLVGEHGLVEFKNTMAKTLVGYLIKGVLPADYFHQVQGQLLVTERVWCDFVVYYPGLWRFAVRVPRDENFIGLLREALLAFCARLDELEEALRAQYASHDVIPAPEEEPCESP